METMSVPNMPVTPHQQLTSQYREQSRPNPADSSSQRTRPKTEIEMYQQQTSAPASQESFISSQSVGSSLGSRLQPSSSNLSQYTQYTDLTSPVSTQPTKAFSQDKENVTATTPRIRTPETTGSNERSVPEEALASPMSVTSPASINGTKRTASGHVKTMSMSSTSLINGDISRRASLSSTGSRAGELAASLKMRLGYAMAKVQNGWEHRTIDEVEQLAANKARHSMSSMDNCRKRPISSGLANGTARLSIQEAYAVDNNPLSPPSKRHSGNYAGFMGGSNQYHYHNNGNNGQHRYDVASTTHTPHLQPAADIRPSTNGGTRCSQSSSRPSSTQITYSSAMSPPRTPTTSNVATAATNGRHRSSRPSVLRTETQTAQAERDALDALFQLGSPHVSQQQSWHHASAASQANSSQAASPLRGDFATPRRVTFGRSDSNESALSSDASVGAIEAERQRTLEGLQTR